MNLPIINLPGVIVGYKDEDFINDTYTYKKGFVVNGYKYTFLYSPKSDFIEVRIAYGNLYRDTKITKELIRYCDISLVAKVFIDLKQQLVIDIGIVRL